MRQRALLGLAQVLQQRTGGGDRQRLIAQAKAAQVAGVELLAQQALGGIQIKMPVGATGDAAAEPALRIKREFFGQQQLGRLQALQLAAERLFAVELLHAEATAGQVQPGQGIAASGKVQRGQQIVAALVHQRLVGDGAGGDDAHHLALDRALAGGRVADLFADRHRLAEFDQLGQIALGSVIGHARHRDGIAAGLAALGQGDVQQARGLDGIVIKQLVEIPHAIEHQAMRVLGLDAQELLHHRGVFDLLIHGAVVLIRGGWRAV